MTRRLLEMVAMLMIGDSVLALISPTRHLGLWLRGPRWWERMFSPLIERPRMVRLIGAAGLGMGLVLAWRQEPRAPRRFVGNHNTWTGRLAEAMR